MDKMMGKSPLSQYKIFHILPFFLLDFQTLSIAFSPPASSGTSLTMSAAASAAAPFAPSSLPLLTQQSRRQKLRQRGQSLSTMTTITSTLSTTTLYNNLLDLIGLGSQEIEPETKLPYSPPLSSELSISDQTRTFAIMERPLSFTGEDYDIVELTTTTNDDDADVVGEGWNGKRMSHDFVRVRGAMMHLPGKDKMNLFSSNSGRKCVVADRVWIAATPSYDILRGDEEDNYSTSKKKKIGWMEKRLIGFQDTFDVYMEGQGGFGITGLFKPTPAYTIVGDFLDRNFSFKNEEGKIVARANMDGWIQFDNLNHYQVRVAGGMDALLVLACVCCIDEEFEEEHRKKRREGR